MFPFVKFYNILILIVTIYNFIICTHQFDVTENRFQRSAVGNVARKTAATTRLGGCSIPLPTRNNPKRPIPTSLNKFKHIAMNGKELNIDQGEFIAYTCDNKKILKVRKKRVQPKIIVKCSSEDELEFDGIKYKYNDFSCDAYLKDVEIKVNSSSKSHLTNDIGPYDCFLSVHGIDYFMPIPFTANKDNPMIMHPDSNGNLIIPQNTDFRLACTGPGNSFATPNPMSENELLVKCLNGSYIEYRGNLLTYLDFTCTSVPKPTLELTRKKCLNNTNDILEVGFKTHFSFLKLYRICFDMEHKNPKYTWYFANTPVYKERQIAKSKMQYFDPQMFDDIDVRLAYRNQSETISKIVKSKSLGTYFIKRDEGRFLTTGHLVSKKEFIYAFEQWSTYFFENTVPQWYLYNKKVWRDLQVVLNEILSKDYTRHLIMTGTYNITRLPERSNYSYPLYLHLPRTLAVPLYLWKLDYDMDRKNGTVYIGMNNPYKPINLQTYICNATPCPTKVLAHKAFEHDLLYCCSKKEFEKTYGPIDPIAFEDF